ncbi:MAG: hypothetical protein VX513_06610 [Pseudomonadota bacterium]|nr:hypothetical protein [Pseudomonadota bacterium]
MSGEINHLDLAMRAARRMRKVKQKRENSRVICYHLKMMLEARDYHLDKNKNGLCMSSFGFDRVIKQPDQRPQSLVAERQYSFMLSG